MYGRSVLRVVKTKTQPAAARGSSHPSGLVRVSVVGERVVAERIAHGDVRKARPPPCALVDQG